MRSRWEPTTPEFKPPSHGYFHKRIKPNGPWKRSPNFNLAPKAKLLQSKKHYRRILNRANAIFVEWKIWLDWWESIWGGCKWGSYNTPTTVTQNVAPYVLMSFKKIPTDLEILERVDIPYIHNRFKLQNSAKKALKYVMIKLQKV